MTEERKRRALASVWTGSQEDSWLVAETPREVADAVDRGRAAGIPLIELTLATPDAGTDHKWNGRIVYVDPEDVTAISPPVDDNTDDE